METALDPATLTPEQREIEGLEAEDNRWRAAVDGRAAGSGAEDGPKGEDVNGGGPDSRNP